MHVAPSTPPGGGPPRATALSTAGEGKKESAGFKTFGSERERECNG